MAIAKAVRVWHDARTMLSHVADGWRQVDTEGMFRVMVSSMAMVLWDPDLLFTVRHLLFKLIRRLDNMQVPSSPPSCLLPPASPAVAVYAAVDRIERP